MLSPTPRARRARVPGLAWAAVVVALHLGLGVALLHLPAWRDRSAPTREQAPLVLWQILASRPPALPERAPSSRRSPAAPAAVAPPATTAAEPQAITLLPAPVEPAAPAATAAPARAQLNLALPRGASAPWRQAPNPALEDRRFNPPPATVESRLGVVMDGTWRIERLDNDRVRMRRGNECYESSRTRAGQLELGNGAFRDLWAVKKC